MHTHARTHTHTNLINAFSNTSLHKHSKQLQSITLGTRLIQCDRCRLICKCES